MTKTLTQESLDKLYAEFDHDWNYAQDESITDLAKRHMKKAYLQGVLDEHSREVFH